MHISTSKNYLVSLRIVSGWHLPGFLVSRSANNENDKLLRAVSEVKRLQSREPLSVQLSLHDIRNSVTHGRLMGKQQILNIIWLKQALQLLTGWLDLEKFGGSLLLPSVVKHEIDKTELFLVDSNGSHLLFQLVNQVVIFVAKCKKEQEAQLFDLRYLLTFNEAGHVVEIVLLWGVLGAGG